MEKKVEEEPVLLDEEEPETKKSVRHLGLYIGVGCAVVAVAVIVVVALVLSHKNSITTEWAKTYYDYLVNAAKNDQGKEIGLQSGTTYAMSFRKFDNYEQPVMVLRETGGKNINIYGIDGEEVNKTINERQDENDKLSVELLYDIQREKYDYFIHHLRSKKESEYISLSEQLKGKDDAKVSYIIKSDDKTSVKDYESGEVYEVSAFDQTFVAPELEKVVEYDFIFSANEEELKKGEKAVAAAEKDYVPIDSLLTATKKDEVSKAVEDVYNRLNELEDVRAKQTLTEENFHDFVDEDLRWFMAAYLGPYRGWSTVYKYEFKDSSVCEEHHKPEEAEKFESCILLSGAGSTSKIKEEMKKHLSDSVITNIDRRFIAGSLGEFTDYNGDVYWMREQNAGEKNYDSVTAKDATFIGVNQSTGAVTVRWKLEAMGYVTDNFTITLQQNEGDYKVISYTRSDR